MDMDIEEGPRIGNGSIVENPASDLVKSESDRIKTFYQTVLSAIMVFVKLQGHEDPLLDHKPQQSSPQQPPRRRGLIHIHDLLVCCGSNDV